MSTAVDRREGGVRGAGHGFPGPKTDIVSCRLSTGVEASRPPTIRSRSPFDRPPCADRTEIAGIAPEAGRSRLGRYAEQARYCRSTATVFAADPRPRVAASRRLAGEQPASSCNPESPEYYSGLIAVTSVERLWKAQGNLLAFRSSGIAGIRRSTILGSSADALFHTTLRPHIGRRGGIAGRVQGADSPEVSGNVGE